MSQGHGASFDEAPPVNEVPDAREADLHELSRECFTTRLGQKGYQPLTIDHQMPVLPGNQVFLGETCQMVCNAWPRGSNQPSQMFMPQGHGQSHAAIIVGKAEILSQIEQDERQPFLELKAHQVSAAQVNPVPSPQQAG